MLPDDPSRPVRCAIYTRKSTEEGLAQEFNSLDAQRECAEAYIQSQRQQGWMKLPEHYDDGGYSGAHLDRPALKRLLDDIEAGSIDCVVVYKVDRLSRSLFDFARLMKVFEQRNVSFVSVTQQLNSGAPMGRLTLNILLSFAQFERELISERTRDKKSAARRKGKWMGGYPVLGYDPDPGSRRLVVNETEAEQVREIFTGFLRNHSLIAALADIHQRGWRMKSWTTRRGECHAGQPFDRPALVRLLTNVVYVGEVSHKGKVYPGEQAAIVDRSVWRRVQDRLQSHERGDETKARTREAALLKGLLVCAGCGKPMMAGYTTKHGRRYSYYVCATAQKRGANRCPGTLVSGRRIETAVVEALFQAAAESGGDKLRKALPVDPEAWERLEQKEQRRIMGAVVEKILYDRQSQQGGLLVRQDVSCKAGKEIAFRAHKKSLVRQHPPMRKEGPVALPVDPRLPRITKLLALAVRFEDLLRRGIARDYADLARLGAVSRARITQVMNLRNLAPAIQERILLHLPASGAEVREGRLRRVAACLSWRRQMQMITKIWPVEEARR